MRSIFQFNQDSSMHILPLNKIIVNKCPYFIYEGTLERYANFLLADLYKQNTCYHTTYPWQWQLVGNLPTTTKNKNQFEYGRILISRPKFLLHIWIFFLTMSKINLITIIYLLEQELTWSKSKNRDQSTLTSIA